MDRDHDELRERATRTYDLAADSFDHPANAYWDRFGRRTVERLAPRPGERVLDVCCGSGSSAIPAAAAVGPAGSVLGVDVSEKLLALAREKARARGLSNLELRRADQLALGMPDGAFDAVISVFGSYFAGDMVAGARELWRMVRPGGRLAVTTWGPRPLEPFDGMFREAVRARRPDLDPDLSPWERLSTADGLRAFLEEAGIRGAAVELEEGRHPVGSFEEAWLFVQGSGLRGTAERLTDVERAAVRAEVVDAMRAGDVREVEANAVYAVATRGA